MRKSNELASVSDREGKSLIVVCIHPQELHYVSQIPWQETNKSIYTDYE